jgi:hypothetical protein
MRLRRRSELVRSKNEAEQWRRVRTERATEAKTKERLDMEKERLTPGEGAISIGGRSNVLEEGTIEKVQVGRSNQDD